MSINKDALETVKSVKVEYNIRLQLLLRIGANFWYHLKTSIA
jgi:hypothetical protein